MIVNKEYNSRFFRLDMHQNESGSGRAIHTYNAEGKITLSDIFLDGGARMKLNVLPDTCTFLIPIVGTLLLNDEPVTSEEVYACNSELQDAVIYNPLEDTINFLQVSLPLSSLSAQPEKFPAKSMLHLNQKNQLIAAEGFAKMISAGVYDSRTKDELIPKQESSHVFVFVLNGSFEVEGRLMEYRDGLLLWSIAAIEIEALSEMAVLLTIEC